ncbi:akt1 substrate 1 protein [Anaeramoeba ignava]|uniref:Akt1 substrate 1 protein n=1 Tax=Anaeramoeba ignava TaxID=1746090 RepID=A0A9Q0LGH0_ANAIG|nr:akt1 substrate 1 protein [Anaeramoeba ignava]
MNYHFSCNCLNIEIISTELKEIKESEKSLLSQLLSTSIKNPIYVKIKGIDIKYHLLYDERIVNGWSVMRCKNCSKDIIARFPLLKGEFIVDSKQLNKNPKLILKKKGFSQLFGIRLPKPTIQNSKIPSYPHLISQNTTKNQEYIIEYEKINKKVERAIQKYQEKKSKKINTKKEEEMKNLKQELKKYENQILTERNILWSQITKQTTHHFSKSLLNRHKKRNPKKKPIKPSTKTTNPSEEPVISQPNPEDDFSTLFGYEENTVKIPSEKSIGNRLSLSPLKISSSPPINSNEEDTENNFQFKYGISAPITINPKPENKALGSPSSPEDKFIQPHIYSRSNQNEQEMIQKFFQVPIRRAPPIMIPKKKKRSSNRK